MTQNKLVIILVAPQMGENIGSAARIMLNFGLTDLRIVNPRDGWPNQSAIDTARGAADVVNNAKVYNSLKDATFDINRLYATTARPRDMVKPVLTPRNCVSEIHSCEAAGQRSAVMFGPERTGLDNEDITLADAITTIPVGTEYTSINLAQAVAIMCYEWFAFQDKTPVRTIELGKSRPAEKLEIANFFEYLEGELDESGFFRQDSMRPTMTKNLRNMFIRADLTDQDIRTLRGLIKSLTKRSESIF